MDKSLFQELYQIEKPSNQLSLCDEDIFPNIKPPQRANSDSTSFFNNSNNKNNSFNQIIKNTDNISSFIQQDNPINQIKNENENGNLEIYNETDKKDKNRIQSNESNNQTTQNFLNSNFFGFKGRSPYSIPNFNNMINNNANINKKNNNVKKENNKSNKINPKNNPIPVNKSQKKNETALVTQLKDKILEYRCSVCNFVANEYDELHKHLIIKKHLILKKTTKGKKKKYFYKKENKLNQTLMYPSKISKKIIANKIVCRYCGKKFDSIYGLNAHLNAHKYKCELCNKLFNTKEELMKHNDMESLYNLKKCDMYNKKNNGKSPKKEKLEIDDWEEISSNKKEKYESDEEINKNDFEQSYVFIGDNDENFDFNKMIRIKYK